MFYRYLGRKLTDLPLRMERLIQAMRHWVDGARSGRCVCAGIGVALRGCFDSDAMRHLSIAMGALDREGLRNVVFYPPTSLAVSDDEAIVLTLFDFAARGDGDRLRRCAASTVAAGGVDRLCAALSSLARGATGDVFSSQDLS